VPRDRVSTVRIVAVEDDEADRRLDNFLLARLKGVPRTHVYRLIRSGQVRVNGRRARPEHRLGPGDQVRIPPVRTAPGTGGRALRPGSADWVDRRILHEDEELLVFDKPTGLATHGGSGVSLGAIEWLRAARPDARALGLAHRLDRDTSGCLVIAKRQSSLRHLQAQFRQGSVEKRYVALLLGHLPGGERWIEAPLLTTERRGGERHVRVDPAGKPARTQLAVVERFAEATLVRVTLLTGRTHQIRVHAAHIGLPLAGDARYGRTPDPVVMRFGLQRLFLHAASISFASPRDGHAIRTTSPLPEELELVLGRMRGDARDDPRAGC
jgi:23S rRNA pseudouridine955/2504/2580 synthase